jgi:hypothetical protein
MFFKSYKYFFYFLIYNYTALKEKWWALADSNCGPADYETQQPSNDSRALCTLKKGAINRLLPILVPLVLGYEASV